MSTQKPLEQTFTVIPSGVNSMAKEVEIFGNYGAMHYQSLLFRFMDHLCGGAYNGGMWEMREYQNGAVVWVFTKEDVIDVHTFNGYEVRTSMFAISIAANIIAMSNMAGDMVDKGAKPEVVDRLIQNFELTRDLGSTFEERSEIYRIID